LILVKWEFVKNFGVWLWQGMSLVCSLRVGSYGSVTGWSTRVERLVYLSDSFIPFEDSFVLGAKTNGVGVWYNEILLDEEVGKESLMVT
jgi:hypothetical protein